jgi:adenylate cyclase
MSFVLLTVTGMTVILCCRVTSPAMTALLLIVFSLCFLGIAHYFFSTHGIWPPVILPLGFQTFSAFLASLYWKYFHAGRERENIRQALGFYLPDKAVKALSEDLSFIKKGDQMVYSVCLMTDAQNYTTLSEKMDPKNLSILMKEYYGYLFDPVNTEGGVVSDVVGDSMLALWPSAKPQPTLRKNACHAALQIIRAVNEFNLQHPYSLLPTRIGLHFGYILIGNIGARSHFEYAPIGDIVNTASRIEGLNKHLGTSILATEEVVSGLEEIVTRKVGIFLLPGKSQPVVIHELLASKDSTQDKQKATLVGLFTRGLACFGEQQWDDAIAIFQQCNNVKNNDGPALFYLNLCKKYQKDPPSPGWQGIVHIAGK